MDQAPQQAQVPNTGVAQLHFFDGRNYTEVTKCLVEFAGFVLAEAQKPEPLSQDKIGGMLSLYINNCLRQGPAAGEEAPAGASCKHIYVKGDNGGKECGKPAKFRGVEGLPKCSTHKTSKPSKDSTNAASGNAAATTSGAAGQTFSYAANQGKGKTAPQTLTSIQQTLAEQTGPVQLQLAQAPDGRIYNPSTNIVFEQRQEGWVAIGVMDGPITAKLSAMEAHVCFGNQWKWDERCVEDAAAKSMGHPLLLQADHPLIAGRDSSLMNKKIESVTFNANPQTQVTNNPPQQTNLPQQMNNSQQQINNPQMGYGVPINNNNNITPGMMAPGIMGQTMPMMGQGMNPGMYNQ